MNLPDSAAYLNHSRQRLWRGACAIILSIGLAAGVAVPGSASPSRLGRFEQLRLRDLRVATVAYRLSVANAARCSDSEPQLGFVLHSIEQYAPVDRDEAARSLGLGSHIGVMTVVHDSPAEAAGLVPGDQLVSVNGQDLGDADPAAAPTRASVDRAQGLLVEEMRRGAVTLRVSGVKGDRDVRFSAETGCASRVELVPGTAVNAWSDGSRVIVSDGLLQLCDTDADLALVIAHEMSHNLLHHRQRLSGAGGLLPFAGGELAEMRESEEEADGLGVRLATAAGYDLSGAESFLGRLLDLTVRAAPTHPDRARRLALLRIAIAAAAPQGRGVAAAGIGNTAAIGRVSGRI